MSSVSPVACVIPAAAEDQANPEFEIGPSGVSVFRNNFQTFNHDVGMRPTDPLSTQRTCFTYAFGDYRQGGLLVDPADNYNDGHIGTAPSVCSVAATDLATFDKELYAFTFEPDSRLLAGTTDQVIMTTTVADTAVNMTSTASKTLSRVIPAATTNPTFTTPFAVATPVTTTPRTATSTSTVARRKSSLWSYQPLRLRRQPKPPPAG